MQPSNVAAMADVQPFSPPRTRLALGPRAGLDRRLNIPDPMKAKTPLFAALLAGLFALLSCDVAAQQTAAFRRFVTRDGKTFYAAVLTKTDLSATFKLQSGQTTVLPIRDLSGPDQQFVRKWTPFKDALMNNAEFAKLSVKEMLELRGYQSFEFDIKGNHIFVEGELNGKRARFMVDTGANSSLIHLDAAKDAGLEIGEFDQEIYGVGGKAMAAVTKVPVLKLGDASIENRKLLTTDLFKNSGGKGEYDAIFGADFLRELDAVISYREGRMFLKPDNAKLAEGKPAQPQAGYAEWKRWTTNEGKNFVAALLDKTDTEVTFRMQNGKAAPWPIDKLSDADKDIVSKWDKLRDVIAKMPEWRTLTVKELLELRGYQSFEYRMAGNHILVDGLVNTTKAVFLIDTGAFSGVLHLAFSKSAGAEVGPMDQTIYGIGGPAPAAKTKVALLKMGDAVIENRTMLSADLYKDMPVIGGKGNHDAIFGANFLRELDGVISYKEARIFLKPDNSDKPAESKPAEKKPAAAAPEKPASK
jgi:predicted aspartyl protease